MSDELTVPFWWHLYWGHVPEMDAFVETMYGESTKPPSELTDEQITYWGDRFYVESFDHEPDSEERSDAVIRMLYQAARPTLEKRKEQAGG